MSKSDEAKRRTCQDCGAFRLANRMLGVSLDPIPPLVRDLHDGGDTEAGR